MPTAWPGLAQRGFLLPPLVRPVAVMVPRVLGQHLPQVPLAEDHQCPYLGWDRRAPRRVRIGPLSLEQPPVPGQQGARCHDPVQPQVSGQQPGQRGEHGTVSPVRPRARGLTPQHRDLMPQDQDLRILSGVTARQEHRPAEHPDHEQIDETDQHGRRA
jgi:hypothetical protein